jgi:hypothetical protein
VPTAKLSGGGKVTVSTIQLQPAADFYVRVNDSNGTLTTKEGKTPGASLLLLVKSPNGSMQILPRTAQDSSGFDYHLPVPFATDLQFVPVSSSFTLTNGAGTQVGQSGGTPTSFNIPTTQQQYQEVLNVH